MTTQSCLVHASEQFLLTHPNNNSGCLFWSQSFPHSLLQPHTLRTTRVWGNTTCRGTISNDRTRGARPPTAAEAYSHAWHVFRRGASFLLILYVDLLSGRISPPKCSIKSFSTIPFNEKETRSIKGGSVLSPTCLQRNILKKCEQRLLQLKVLF